MLLVQQLADINRKIDDEEVAEILLSGLPKEYDALVSNLETAFMTGSLSSEIVRAQLLQEELRKTSTTSTLDSAANNTAFISKKKTVICNHCKKQGHTRNKCFKLKRERKKKKEDHSFMASAFLATNNEWFVDSGCSAAL
ncbi:unnamed protein product [Arctia plantaginis]|uniref:Retrovirus-related Pol polyprotein from transposon TNT 1-94 n=1 Tax=Arctia plantaginis TaxID=874455 RepID=A0A8S1ATG4_ARCPL|nr:unnamed protein product [Arctia plantaginis]